MLYHIGTLLTPYCSAFNVIHYVSFRAMAALLTTLGCAFIGGAAFIRYAQTHFRAKAREHTPERHKQKDNLPTMGGLFIVGVSVLNILLWADLTKPTVWALLACLLGFACLGAWDDWCKIRTRNLPEVSAGPARHLSQTNAGGIRGNAKFAIQVALAGLIVGGWLWSSHASTTVTLPFLKDVQLDLGLGFIAWAMFIIIGCSNAVNLTDGLDGLAIGSLLPNFATFAIISYLAGHSKMASYLNIPFAGTAEGAIVASILVGASLGFFWYNAYPAQIFMGDVGSLSLGAMLALLALMAKQELLLVIAGGVFVAETVSVILQVLSFKLRGKRIFRMAPMHHHFELIGWQEPKITVRFAIISFILCLLALMTLKLR